MSFGKKVPKVPMYEEMQDTPWITQGRDLADKGYQGIVDNYKNVDVFNQDTQRNLDAQTNAIYNRAEQDYARQYRDTMLKMQNANYGQFGTTNATPALYRTDMANLEAQRHLADSAYNKALYREQLINNELQRRYNTLNMYNNMYNRGEIPYKQDIQNWQIRNLNKDRQFQNQIADYNQSGNFGRWLGSFLDPFDIGGGAEMLGPTYSNQVSGNSATVSGDRALGLFLTIMGAIKGNSQMMNTGGQLFNTTNQEDMMSSQLGNNMLMNALQGSSSGSALHDALLNYTGGNSGGNFVI